MTNQERLNVRAKFFRERAASYTRACNHCNFWKRMDPSWKGPGAAIYRARTATGNREWHFGKLP